MLLLTTKGNEDSCCSPWAALVDFSGHIFFEWVRQIKGLIELLIFRGVLSSETGGGSSSRFIFPSSFADELPNGMCDSFELVDIDAC